ERLFVDLMPLTWQGLPPGLPPTVVAELTERAKAAAVKAEEERKAREARELNPRATLHVGRNPTFVRIEIEWSVPTEGKFVQTDSAAEIKFDWPVPIDLYMLQADLPPEILGVANEVSPSGSTIAMTLREGIVPRFYGDDPKHFTLDIDLTSEDAQRIRTTAEAAAKQAEAEAEAARVEAAKKRAELA